MEVVEQGPHNSSTTDLTENSVTPVNGIVKSKIPRFKRSQSMRLKGEKFRPPLQTSTFMPPPRSSLTLCNLRVLENDNDYDDDDLKSEVSVTTAHNQRRLSLKTNSVGGGDHHHHHHHHHHNNDCRQNKMKGNTPSEYGSLPPTPLPSPDAEDSHSVKSFGSAMSLDAFTSASLAAVRGIRRKKFVVHCQSHHNDEEEYLTPTQRKDRLIRQLKAMLLRSRRELDEKDAEILRLTKELLELKLFKSDMLSKESSPIEPAVARSDTKSYEDLNSVFLSTRDSGLFEESVDRETAYESGSLVSASCKDEATNTSLCCDDNLKLMHAVSTRKVDATSCLQVVQEEICRREIDDLKRLHGNEYQEMKEKYNDRIENLLQKLSESNSRYFDLRPKYDRSQERIRHLEAQIQMLEAETKDDDKRHHQMYLKMYKKGQEAALFEHADEVLEFAHKAPKRVSVPEVLKQLQMTERELDRVKALYRREICKHADGGNRDSEITLKFLKDAIYYFLTDKDGRDHLKAIESIMDYSESERHNIERSVFSKRN